jgi:hypothetical protein
MSKALFFEKRKDNRENDTYDYARCYRKVEAESLLFYHYVAGKFSDEWYFVSPQEAYPHHYKDDSENNEHLSHSGHHVSL